MTAVAVLAKRTSVMVVLLMAAHTFHVSARKLIADMAALARHHTVEAHQGEVGKVMVKTIDDVPAVSDMAGGAHLHVGILVNVISGVAGGTIPRQIILQRAHVAVGASELLVMPRQRKTGFGGMVEFRFVPIHRGMARLTLFAIAA